MQTGKRLSPDDKRIGSLVRTRRMQLGRSQEWLAKQIGRITFQQVQKYENGSNRISAVALSKISKALEVPLDYFFEDSIEGTSDVLTENIRLFTTSRPGLDIIEAFGGLSDRQQRAFADCIVLSARA